ncbi:MAG: hypothetical protein KAH68_04775 [Draconibacterium sp.]|nr:hypothetical protein [Draconibacterium sp.]
MRKVFIILSVFIFVYGNVLAQNDTTKIILKKSMLNGHIFNSINTSKSAFINTYLNTELGFGNTGNLDLPGIVIGDNEILSFNGSVTYITVNLDYRQKINDWMAFRLSMSLGGRIGSNISTILVDGLNTYGGVIVGWDFRLVQKQKFQMAGSVFVKNITGSFIDIAGYVNDIIHNAPFPEPVRNIPVLTFGIGNQCAYAFNKTYGMQFGVDFSYGESFNRSEQNFYSSFNISGDMDLMPKKQIPLGFAVGYEISSNPEDTYLEFIHTNIFSGKIAYTGSSDFDLGLQFIMNRVKLSDAITDNPMSVKTQLDFKFYF